MVVSVLVRFMNVPARRLMRALREPDELPPGRPGLAPVLNPTPPAVTSTVPVNDSWALNWRTPAPALVTVPASPTQPWTVRVGWSGATDVPLTVIGLTVM